MKIVEVTATPVQEIYRNGEFAIVEVAVVPGTPNANDAPRSFAVKGDFDVLEYGIEYRFCGLWQETPRYGKQLKVETYTTAEPHSENGILRYLCKAPHVGHTTATALWDLYQSNAVNQLRNHPAETADALAGVVRGFSRERATEAAMYLESEKATQDLEIQLTDLLSKHRMPRSMTRHLIAKFGNLAVKRIRHDPFLLMQFRGAGWEKCDAMYLSLGLPPGRLKRQVYFILHAISEDRGGHTWLNLETILRRMTMKIGSEHANPEKALELGRRAKKFYIAKTKD